MKNLGAGMNIKELWNWWKIFKDYWDSSQVGEEICDPNISTLFFTGLPIIYVIYLF